MAGEQKAVSECVGYVAWSYREPALTLPLTSFTSLRNMTKLFHTARIELVMPAKGLIFMTILLAPS